MLFRSYETGKLTPAIPALIRLAQTLNVTIDYLIIEGAPADPSTTPTPNSPTASTNSANSTPTTATPSSTSSTDSSPKTASATHYKPPANNHACLLHRSGRLVAAEPCPHAKRHGSNQRTAE